MKCESTSAKYSTALFCRDLCKQPLLRVLLEFLQSAFSVGRTSATISWQFHAPGGSKTLPGASRNSSKSTPQQVRAQMRPRAPKRRSTGAQETPKSAQKLPKSAPDASHTGPEGSQTPPKTSPARSKMHFGHDRRRQPHSKGCRTVFLRFVALCALLAKCLPIH